MLPVQLNIKQWKMMSVFCWQGTTKHNITVNAGKGSSCPRIESVDVQRRIEPNIWISTQNYDLTLIMAQIIIMLSMVQM